ncbi:DNA binding protein [Mycobacterium phage Yoshi]|uniref:Helix-turn-helix DNA-binding domain protein n=4 Tax=Gracegardnervirinae TaxID=2946632 RepID=A0A385DZN7_9CAUD|nr:DNA binding protein [Mycobacterium phage Yoshi]YP_009838014.1 DNA binding protein [Mycobacterium phage TChen]YP_009841088.1 DNA binding protein [Mycobacterium phage Renaud18]YP_009848881.1 DNA binding protein [Mycobacterium phage ThetaBob]AEK07820.1 helix-turn-helix DNA binding protein [Mycobacterium phage Yoshi]AWH14457.1 hypothetical protein SEA_TCHEN_58 [Mycobacterium phage TChen]AXQ64970.1 helix-turn-helix DNA-binding domain protein [Mycobacterium phage Renaud18]QDF19949.1 helix-turn-
MTGRVLTPIEVEKVAWWTQLGWTAAQIADKLGCTTRTVSRARAKSGVAKPKPPALSAEVLAEAARMLADGASQNEVARTLGVGQSTISAHFRGQGWTREQSIEWVSFLRRYRGVA